MLGLHTIYSRACERARVYISLDWYGCASERREIFLINHSPTGLGMRLRILAGGKKMDCFDFTPTKHTQREWECFVPAESIEQTPAPIEPARRPRT